MSELKDAKRRRFLIGVGAGGASAAAALVVGGKDASNQQVAAQKDAKRKGYQLTEHVRNYYRTARV